MLKEVLESKYGEWRDLRNQRHCSLNSLWWKDLKEVWALEGWRGSFKENCTWEVGNGREIRLCEDKWMGNTSLKAKFPRLFKICVDRESFLK